MKVKHTTQYGYTITIDYSFGFIYHRQVDHYDHDGNWIASDTTMESSSEERLDIPLFHRRGEETWLQ